MRSRVSRRGGQPRRASWIADGRLYCPLVQADIDIERCLVCPWLKDRGTAQRGSWVRCGLPAEIAMPRFSSVLTTGRETR